MSSSQRVTTIDGLRGAAALGVTLFHICRDAPGMHWAYWGQLGVPIFFVISGYVISHGFLTRKVTAPVAGNFVLRRVIRLDPPYWSAIALALLVQLGLNWLKAPPDRTPLPSAACILANMFYLQQYLGFENINVVFWTLCQEVQFYLAFCLMLWLADRTATISGRRPDTLRFALIASAVALCLAYPLEIVSSSVPGSFLPLWHLFLLGVVTRYCLLGVRWGVLFGITAATLLFVAVYFQSASTAAAVLTALFIVVTSPRANSFPIVTGPLLLYLGQISYSLYLVHDIVGVPARDIGVRAISKMLGSDNPPDWVPVVCSLSAVALCIAAAHLFWRYIERPFLNLSKKVRAKPAPLEPAQAEPNPAQQPTTA